jgi:chemotaxis family two-component system sensor kinase Cph1
VSDLEQRVQELQAANVELQRSNEDLERFAYAASHDLSEPLRAMSGMVQLLARRYEGRLGADADMYISRAVAASRRMQVLIDDLLVYSRVGHGEVAADAVDCQALVERVLADLRQPIEDACATVTMGFLPTVEGDATQLRQVFQNLISNALKFHGDATPGIHVSAAPAGCEWRFALTDNGIGIEPRHADRVFEVFKRLHGASAYPGTGMGLAICKRIVERHGGRIWVEPAQGGGSRFQFTLPNTQQEKKDGVAGAR